MFIQIISAWWSTQKSAVYGSTCHCPLSLVSGGLLSDRIDSKQSREAVELPLTRHQSPSLPTFAFRSSEVRLLVLDFDPYGGTDLVGMFPLFLKRTADVMAHCLIVVFRWLIRLGIFPVCWRLANVTHIPKGPLASSLANYR